MFNELPVLDVHGHCAAPLDKYTPLLLMMAANMAIPSAVRTGSMPPVLPYDLENLAPAVEGHVGDLDERDIDVQILGPRPMLHFGWSSSHLQEAAAQLTNDLIEVSCSLAPDRFLGAAQLPQLSTAPDAGHMLSEFDRCVDDLGFVAAYVSPNPCGERQTPGMHSTYWDPLYQRASERDIPLIVHGTVNRDPRAQDIAINYLMGFATEEYIAKELLTRGYVFDRFPDLKVLVCHCGGMLERHLPNDPVHVVQDDLTGNLFFDTCAFDVDFLTAAIRQRGVDAMCFGTEVPGGSVGHHPEDGIGGDDLVRRIDSFDWLSELDKRKIFFENPLTFCKGFIDRLPAGLRRQLRSEAAAEATAEHVGLAEVGANDGGLAEAGPVDSGWGEADVPPLGAVDRYPAETASPAPVSLAWSADEEEGAAS